MELQVSQDASTWKEGAAHASEQVPVGVACRAVWLRHVIGLFDKLAIDLISDWPEVLAGLQDSLDDGDGVSHDLHLLQRVKDLHCFILETRVTFLLMDWSETERQTDIYNPFLE